MFDPSTIRPLDLILGVGDHVQVEIQSRGKDKVLYIHVNGASVLRIHAPSIQIEPSTLARIIGELK